MYRTVALILISSLFFLGLGITDYQRTQLINKHKTKCIETGKIISPSAGYFYICKDGNFTSFHDSGGYEPKIVTMYHVCHDATMVDNSENVTCGYKPLLIQFALLLTVAVLTISIAIIKICIDTCPPPDF